MRAWYVIVIYALTGIGAIGLAVRLDELLSQGSKGLDPALLLVLVVSVVLFVLVGIGRGMEAAALFAAEQRTKKIEERLEKLEALLKKAMGG